MFHLARINKVSSSVFGNARIKLTAWYFVIIMFISAFFSIAIYRVLTSELDRVERMQRSRIEHDRPIGVLPIIDDQTRNFFFLDPQLIEETKNRLKLILVLIDMGILGASTAGGYFLAGKTLKPIKEMVDEQDRFISDASHELRTPLTSMKTEVEVALRNSKLNISEAKKLLKSNLEEVDKMQKLSNYLLSLNRHQNSLTNIEFKKVNLKKIYELAITKILPLAKTKNLTLKKELKDTYITGNEELLIQLALILLDNSIKYSRGDGKIIVRTKKTGEGALLEVQDFGEGINPKDLPHIFERFYRADISRSKEKTDGYGLGLSIAENIVKTNKGSISVKSTLKKGSKFSVFFPTKHV